MQTPYSNYLKQHFHNARGFTLIELMVVITIVGILAVGVVFMFADPTAKVKAAAFEMRGDFNLARAEAVKENEEVRIDFDPANDSYRIWLDDSFAGTPPTSGPPPQDGTYTPGEDTLIKEVIFRNEVKYYDFSGTVPTNGPVNDPQTPPISLDGQSGITLGSTTLTFFSNGTCDSAGSVVVYYPKDGDPATQIVKGNPYAVVIENVNTGRVLLERWRPESASWSRK